MSNSSRKQSPHTGAPERIQDLPGTGPQRHLVPFETPSCGGHGKKVIPKEKKQYLSVNRCHLERNSCAAISFVLGGREYQWFQDVSRFRVHLLIHPPPLSPFDSPDPWMMTNNVCPLAQSVLQKKLETPSAGCENLFLCSEVIKSLAKICRTKTSQTEPKDSGSNSSGCAHLLCLAPQLPEAK